MIMIMGKIPNITVVDADNPRGSVLVLNQINKPKFNKNKVPSLRDIEESFGNCRGDFVVIAARTGVGKTNGNK